MSGNDNRTLRRLRRTIGVIIALITLPLLLTATSVEQQTAVAAKAKDTLPEIKPQIPKANRNNSQRVFLEHADLLRRVEYDSFMILTGNVEFSHGAMLMFCDSAHFYPETESLEAFGDVRMRQGDTLFIYASELNYRGDTHVAYLYGDSYDDVRMINRDVHLETPTFVYNLAYEFGYYTEGGVLYDTKNRLTSIEGEYIPGTKEANFYQDVVLQSRSQEDTLYIYTDTLFYNTTTHVAELISPSTIINAQATITTDNGTYNTDNEIAELFNRSKVVASTGTTLEGDTLYYDRSKGYGEVYGNMEIVDTAHCVILTGDYGYYNEVADSSFATGRALAREYSQGDTLYMHGRYLYSYTVRDTTHIPEDTIAGTEAYSIIDTTHVMVAHPRVRFYRSDMQGVCDSMRFEERDSMMYMYHHPIVWNGERQIFGNIIQVHLNDSTVDRAILPDMAFTAEHIEDVYFNQLSSKEMIAYFEDGELRRLDVNGNVQAIMLPEEKDSTFNKIVNVESSFLTADFRGQAIERMKMWPQTNGTVTPLYLAKKSLLRLPNFHWYIGIRPTSPDDVMVIPPAMEELMADIPQTTIVPPRRWNITPEDSPTEPDGPDATDESATESPETVTDDITETVTETATEDVADDTTESVTEDTTETVTEPDPDIQLSE